MRDLSSADNFFARAIPPFEAPSLLRATAAGFFRFLGCLGMVLLMYQKIGTEQH
jgi:hypothetical protein